MNLARRDFIKKAAATTLAAAASRPLWAQSSQKITVAIVGAAHIHAPGYLNFLHSRKDVVIKYVWDHDAARAERWAKSTDAQVAPDLKSIWNDADIRAVFILSETNLHHDLVIAAAKAGKDLFVEKPLGVGGAESREMAAAIEEAKVLFTTGYFMRSDPKHLFLKEEIAAGHFGKISRVQASLCHGGALSGIFDGEYRWMAEPKIAGVGAFGDLGTHKLDILLWLFGDIEAVTGEIHSVIQRYPDCDESGQALLRFRNGISGVLAAGWVDIADPITLLISGTEGYAVIYQDQLYYQSKKVAGSDLHKPWAALPPEPAGAGGHLRPLDQFLNAVGGSKNEPLVTASEAAVRVAVMEAIYEGARERKWVGIG
jgi:predicted dehydrogenase